jgi:3-(methylthio)propanoyl-CoA dehydrogenase
MTYTPPLTELSFALKYLVGLQNLQTIGYELSAELVDDVLQGAGAVAAGDFAPLNHAGDKTGARLTSQGVVMPAGCRAAYQAFAEGGWNAVPFPTAEGGMGLPWVMGYAVQEMFQSANMALALVTLLNQGAIELLAAHADAKIKELYLPPLMRGEWTATMNLTEPQAGSDLNAIRMLARPEGEYYRLKGQKIFISYGDHDLAGNILHLVLARTPDAPEGTRGLSLFLVPKKLVNTDGSLGEPNDLRAIALEHKLGLHTSPTCVMAYGDGEGAIGYLIGEAHGGISAMFTMMNNARIGVGIQGLGIAERAYQAAVAYAKGRIQGRPLADKTAPPAAIIEHADVKRMLMSMRAQIEAGRALVMAAGYMADRARMAQEPASQARFELLTPIVKALLTDMANDVTSTAIQIAGGMGYVEETGLAQHYRDARVLAIYEGTNGIQAQDLAFRKLTRDQADAIYNLALEMVELERDFALLFADDDAISIRENLAFARTDLESATQMMLDFLSGQKEVAAAAATTYLRLAGLAISGLYLGYAAREAMALRDEGHQGIEPEFLLQKILVARFYAENFLPQTQGLRLALSHSATLKRINAECF